MVQAEIDETMLDLRSLGRFTRKILGNRMLRTSIEWENTRVGYVKIFIRQHLVCLVEQLIVDS